MTRRWHMPFRTAALCLAATSLAGCTPQPVAEPISSMPPPDVQALIDLHNHRVSRLSDVYARGVVELRWVDDEGRSHLEPQINVDLWIDLPSGTSMRLAKLGEVYLWMGSDAEKYWLFDLVSEERVLYIGGHDHALAFGDRFPVPFQPLQLLDLIGITPIDAVAGDVSTVTFDEAHDAWSLIGPTEGANRTRLRYLFDRTSSALDRVELLDAEGEPLLVAALGNMQFVNTPNVPTLRQPQIPGDIDIRTADGASHVKLVLRDPAAETATNPFNLDRLRAGLRPARVEDARQMD